MTYPAVTTRPLPLGTHVAILEDTFGEHAATGTIAGYVTYTTPGDAPFGMVDNGYAVHLDHGDYLDQPGVPNGSRPYIGTIVVHVESVTAVTPTTEFTLY